MTAEPLEEEFALIDSVFGPGSFHRPAWERIQAEHRRTMTLRCTGIVPKTAIRCRLTAAHKGRCLPLSPLHETVTEPT